ncbi:MAG: hypothetical protein PHS54_02475 [Clostridia bacterium]|nr:hypothetical protein [Clostridia bacterium]
MKKNRTFNKIFIFLFSIICVVACVFVAQVCSSFLAIGSLAVSSNTTNSISEFKVYAISLGAHSTKYLADTSAATFKQKNAGGYVLKVNGAYHVLASAYEKENDAKLVQDNLLLEEINSEIIELTFESILFESVSSKSQEKEFIDSLSVFKIVFLELYDVSVSLDTSVIDKTMAKIEIISIKADVEERLEKINKGTTAIDGIYYQTIKNKYNDVIDALILLKNYEETDGIILSAKIKYYYLNILDMATDLINTLNNEI